MANRNVSPKKTGKSKAPKKPVQPQKTTRGSGNDYGKMLPFYVILALREISSREHPVISPDIRRWLITNRNSAAARIPSRTTIDTCLEQLAGESFFYIENREDPNALGFGYSINCIVDQNPNGTTSRKYYLESDLEQDQVILIMDSVEAYTYMDNRDTRNLISYFSKLYPKARRSYPKDNPEKADLSRIKNNNLLAANITIFKNLIDNGGYARIWNGYYGIVENKDKKPVLDLLPRHKGGQLIKPLDLLWNNGSYYLIAGLQRTSTTKIPLVHFRLDRILDLEEILGSEDPEEFRNCEEIFKLTPPYDPVSYQKKNPSMFSGDRRRVKLLCHLTPRNGMMNSLIDAFGFHPHSLRIPSEKDLKKHLGKNADRILKASPDYSQTPGSSDCWIIIDYDSSDEGAVQFVLEHSADCKALSPKKVFEEVDQILKQASLLNCT